MASGSKRLPPYVSYRTFLNFISGLQLGIPARLDRSYWGDRWSGSTGTQLMAALRFLGLADGEGIPTNRLRQLTVAKGPSRADMLRIIANEAYGPLFRDSFDPQAATYSQLEEVFHGGYKLADDVARKCIKFFVCLANDSGMPISPFVTKKSKRLRATNAKKTARKPLRTDGNVLIPDVNAKTDDGMTLDKLLLNKFPALDPSWPDEVKSKWFDAYHELLQHIIGGNGREAA